MTLDAYLRSVPFLSRQIGPRTPLYFMALGKVLLAFLGQSLLDAYLAGSEFMAYTPNTIVRKKQLL